MLSDEYRAPLVQMEWADAQVWRAVLATPEAHTDALTLQRLYHVHLVQWLYLQIWRGEPLAIRDVATFEGLPEIHTWAREYYQALGEYINSATPDVLERRIDFPWADQLEKHFGQARPATFRETLVQITSHTAYHRGQINARLRELGGEPPLTDFIAWIWMGKPEPRWESPAAI